MLAHSPFRGEGFERLILTIIKLINYIPIILFPDDHLMQLILSNSLAFKQLIVIYTLQIILL